MLEPEKPAFDAGDYLANAGHGRRIVKLDGKRIFFSQGDVADPVFYLQCGRAKLTVISRNGQQATITVLAAGDFFGEESLARAGALHTATATAITGCKALRIDREEMLYVLHEERAISDLFMNFLLARGMRIQSELVDQLFYSSEKRLARVLLLMANFGGLVESEKPIPAITLKGLAEMIGESQASVSFLINRFRVLGFIDYNGQIRVRRTLLNVILRDRLPGDNTVTPNIVDLAS
jgi:CRP-like cAMP-binding protein